MAFEVVQLAPTIYHLQSGANSGLIAAGNQAIVIDAGLDDDAGKKIKKTIESLGLSLNALIITHAHADHFGGAAYLRRTLPPFTVYAPALEAAIIENPLLEGIMLSGGALPFDALKGKFTLAQACKVDQIIAPDQTTLAIAGIDLTIVPLPGHSPAQIGIQYQNVLFTADAFLPIETLEKHPIPFTAHFGQAFDTLDKLLMFAKDNVHFAPGHGKQSTDCDGAIGVINANINALNEVISALSDGIKIVEREIQIESVAYDASLTKSVVDALMYDASVPVSYYLARATVQAALVWMYERKQVDLRGIRWRLVPGSEV